MSKNLSDNGSWSVNADIRVIRHTENPSLPDSEFVFAYQIEHCYSSKSSPSPLIKYYPSLPFHIHVPFEDIFKSQSQSLVDLSTFISHANIPFLHTTLLWDPIQSPTPVRIQSLDDLTRRVREEMNSIGSELEFLYQDSKVVVEVCLILEWCVVLSDDEFEALCQGLAKETQYAEGLENLAKEYRMRDDFSIRGFRELVFRERGLVMKEERVDQLMEVVLKERLLKVETLTLDQDCEELLCSICHEKLRDDEDDEDKVETPCSHLFHETCIMKWIKNNNACPMCRFRF